MKRRCRNHPFYRAARRRGVLFSALACVVVLTTPVLPAEVQIVRIDGTQTDGQWLGLADRDRIRLQTPDGIEALRLDGLARIAFLPASREPEPDVAAGLFPPPPTAEEPAPSDAPAPDPDASGARPTAVPALFHLADGGALRGRLLSPPPQTDALSTNTAMGERVPLPFSRLAAVQVAGREGLFRADDLFTETLRNRLPGHDVLITRDLDEPRAVRGRLESMDAVEGTFVFAEQPRTFRTEKVYGLVFAAGATAGAQENLLEVVLEDGSSVSGRISDADAERITLETSLGLTASLPVKRLRLIRVRSDRVVYLTDLTPTAINADGLVHRPWPARFDESVTRKPLRLGGRTFSRGLGVHSRSEITYDIGGEYEKLAVTIGIDDAVRPGGSVIFRVLGDGRELFSSGLITGRDPATPVIVDVQDVEQLTLIVDYGDGLDIGDQADWADARLLKPAETAPAGPS